MLKKQNSDQLNALAHFELKRSFFNFKIAKSEERFINWEKLWELLLNSVGKMGKTHSIKDTSILMKGR